MTERPFSRERAHQYWIERHRRYSGSWQSVGMLDAGDDLNRVFYTCRQRALESALEHCRTNLSGMRVLDAGCGSGRFSRFYGLAGAEVWGLDISPDAVAYCDSHGIGAFVVGSVNEVADKFEGLFDIIHCFDVLYHLTDEEEWQSTLGAFAALSHRSTLWMLTEFRVSERMSGAPHITRRSFREYQKELASHGRSISLEIPLYWFYSAFPRLATWFPSWILAAEHFSWFSKQWMKEHVVFWVVAADQRQFQPCSEDRGAGVTVV